MFKLENCLILVVVALAISACEASIDRSPVRVTDRNSGPSYDLTDDVERVKLPIGGAVAEPSFDDRRREMSNNIPSNKDDAENSTPDIGRISIRRIFIVPMGPPPSASDSEDSKSQGPSNPFESMLPFMMMRPVSPGPVDTETSPSDADKPMRHPLWPMFTPQSSIPRRHHLFGSDMNSRSPFDNEPASSVSESKPKASAPGEREEATRSVSDQERPKASVDPIQMLLSMMLDTMNQAQNHMSANSNSDSPLDNTRKLITDLNKEASDTEKRDHIPSETGLSKPPKKPTSHNETREDVVELEGKKYLRKTVLNRHVGENMVFVTRRLIFVPLNETESATATPSSENQSTTTTTTTTTTMAPSSTTSAGNAESAPTTPSTTTTSTTDINRKIEEAGPVSTSSTTTTSTTEATSTTSGPTTEKNKDSASS